MSVGSLSTTTMTWLRRTYQPDGDAPSTKRLGNLRGRVQPLSGTERAQYGTELASVTHRVYVSGTPAIRASDLLELPGGVELIVRSVRDVDLLGRYTAIDAESQT